MPQTNFILIICDQMRADFLGTYGCSSAYTPNIDGLAGATLTSRGVDNLVRYWVGESGFGPFLKNIAEELAANG